MTAIIKLAPDGSLEVHDDNASATELAKVATRLWNHVRRYPQRPRGQGMGFTLPDPGRCPTKTVLPTAQPAYWRRGVQPAIAETGLASCDTAPPVPAHGDPDLPPPDFDG